jgi:hypothetical protein
VIEELPRLVQECEKKWDGIAWEQIAKVKYEAIYSKNGETKAENVDTVHE